MNATYRDEKQASERRINIWILTWRFRRARFIRPFACPFPRFPESSLAPPADTRNGRELTAVRFFRHAGTLKERLHCPYKWT